jgi:phosphoserine phosphatase RsbU/P
VNPSLLSATEVRDSPREAAPLPPAAGDVLVDFRRAYPGARVWRRVGAAWTGEEGDGSPAPEAAPVPGYALAVEVPGADAGAAASAARFLGSAIGRAAAHDEEIRSFSREIAERYEEITLLYSISEILGSIISLEDASRTILAEVAGILGAGRAALWVYDGESRTLRLAAVSGGEGQTGPIPVDDPCSLTAGVFREGRPVILGPGEEHRRPDCPRLERQHGSFLSVPVSYTPPEGEVRPVGVINLIGRSGSGDGFSAGDLKLLSAIASQIGAAVENNRLIAATLRQERMVRELELAHDLQLKLLPPLEPFQEIAEVAARCVPAESVGGDFYHLFRLPHGRLGVLIGDVSSHGFGAALIMALTISAVAIHAAEGDAPSQVLHRTHRAVIDELENTEMYLTLFYAVIDRAAGTLSYSNAGHSHAFRVGAEGEAARLEATDPPFGIVDRDTYGERTVSWRAGEDLLFLFTDGLSDALGLGEVGGERALVDEVVQMRAEPPRLICERLFERSGRPAHTPPDDRTAVVVRF